MLHRYAHGCVGTASRKNGGVGPVRETMAKGSDLPGHEGKHRDRHCTGTGRGAAQSEGSGAAEVTSYPQTINGVC